MFVTIYQDIEKIYQFMADVTVNDLYHWTNTTNINYNESGLHVHVITLVYIDISVTVTYKQSNRMHLEGVIKCVLIQTK